MEFTSNPEFWVAVALFGFLALLIYFKVPGKIAELLDKRADAIRQELDQARQLREEAQAILADYQRKHKGAEQEAQEIVRLAKQEAEALAAETRAKLEDSLERRTRIAEEKIGRAEEQALAEVRSVAIDVAIAAADQIIQKKMTPAATARLVDESIKGLKGKLN